MKQIDYQTALDLITGGDNLDEKLRGVRWLLEYGGKKGVEDLFSFRVQIDDEPRLTEKIEKFLIEKGYIINLSPYVVDNWFDSMVRSIDGFEEVCDLVGYRFVAFAVIAGINLRAVNHNPEFPAQSTIEFSVGKEDRVDELPIEEFRKSLIYSMLSPDRDEPVKFSTPPRREEISALFGGRYFLLAPLYNMRLRDLLILDPDAGLDGYKVELEVDGRIHQWSIKEFRSNLRAMVSSEKVEEYEPIGRFSAEAIAGAEKALEAGNPAGALRKLRDWVLFVRNYRIAGGVTQMLGEVDAHFARGLLLTGRAYRLLNRNRISEDILRFSIQLLPDSETKPTLFYELALIMMSEGRYGEAIAPLRRALKLGIPTSLIYPYLARAFMETGRTVAAFLILGELNREGLLDEEMKKLYESARTKLGDVVAIIEEIPHYME